MTGMRVNVSNKMKRISARVEGGMGTALQAGAALMQREIMMAAMGMSIWDTGNLINAHTRRRSGAMEWEILSPAEYSVWVHQGTTRMSARPWFDSGIANAEPKVIAMLRKDDDGMTITGDTITPTATAIRSKLTGYTAIAAIVAQRVYYAAPPDTAAYPHIVMKPAAAPERDATHTDLSWQAQQWDIYAVADSGDAANALAGLVAAALNGQTLTIASTTSLLVRRMGTMPATRVRLSDTVSKYMAAATMLVGVRTGGQA